MSVLTQSVEPASASVSIGLAEVTARARQWQSEGREKEAHDLLSPAYGQAWFTGGLEAGVLNEAKLLLDELT